MSEPVHEMILTLDRQEGALVRLLGLIERRGFRTVELGCRERSDTLVVRVKLDGQRRAAEVLIRQIERLHDVRGAELVAQRPVTKLPAQRRPIVQIPASAVSRRSMSFLGIPDFVSTERVPR